ncbi:hypothetical protein NIES2101_38120 [Calothrix sp. HK-06]|nr:hypothetical protein NIES2101_38120 [Calothrix sp. HK-06]
MQHEILSKLRIKPSTVGWGVAVLTGLIFAFPNLKAYQDDVNQEWKENKNLESKNSKLQRQFEFEQQQAEIANKRYESCLPVVGEFMRNGTHYFTGLREGDKPTDRITRELLPSGTVVCDANGTTGVIGSDGKVGFLAYTGNRDIIQSRLKRFRGSQFSQPVIRGN